MVTGSPGHVSFTEMLYTAARLGIKGVEFNAANWTSAPHCNVKEFSSAAGARKEFLTAVKRRGLEIIALAIPCALHNYGKVIEVTLLNLYF
jgi:sugar phosphate isomerase/epimerase